MKFLQFISLTAILFLSTSVFCQEEEPLDLIPTSPSECYKYMEEIMLKTKRNECVEIMEEWKQKQKSNKWTSEHYQGFADLGNEMIAHNMKRFNFFRHLIVIINSFSDDSGLSSQHFDKFISLAIKLLKDQPAGKSADFENILKFFRSFWKTGNLYDISKGSHKWKSESRVFDMKYEDGVLSIKYEKTNLICFYKSDSLEIQDVRGIYYPLEQKFKGIEGRVNWTSEGASDAYAMLKKYTISTRSTSYSSYDAVLHYNSIFKKPIVGTLRDVATKRNSKKLRYPKFESKYRNIKMDDIGEGVNYIGGFAMSGSSVQGHGDKKGLSVITVKNSKGEVVIKAKSSSFDILKGEKVISKDSEVVLYIYNDDATVDSIFHPSIHFLYNITNRYVELTRGETRTSRVAFTNSLQEMDLKVTAMKWFIDTDNLILGDNVQNLEMASKNHFDQRLFEKYQNISSINPIIKFAVYSIKLEESEGSGEKEEFEESWEEALTDEEFCEMQPDFCDGFGNRLFDDSEEDVPLDTAFLKEIGEWPPSEEMEEEPEPIDMIETGPRIIDADELAALLDPRMEKITILTAEEVEKAKKNPIFKEITRDQDYRDFVKGYPRTFKFGIMNVYDLLTVVPRSTFDKRSSLPLFLEMVKDGFLVYNDENGTITLRDKLFHYAASVNRKQRDHDFDKIRIKSVPSHNNKKAANAVFDMKKGVIETYGVQEFILSDSQQVVAKPFEGLVEMKKGRDMDFNGVMTGGFCNFTGMNFHFIYEIFHVELDSINFMDIFIFKRERYDENAGLMAGRPKKERAINKQTQELSYDKEPINSVIEGGTGLLLIDVPSNKSGRMISDPIYPSFELTTNSRVYYDRNNRLGDVYPRESFYYELEPFMLDGMDELEPEQLVFDGKLYAADIFEPITEKLSVMYHDLSLGFETETRGNDPNPVYIRDDKKGKGVFKGIVGVSNEGFLGNGTLNYLGATIESEYIEFIPDYFKADNVDSFLLVGSERDGVAFPDVKGQQVKIEWTPYSDSMYVESIDVDGIPFQFFDSTDFNLSDGSITLTPRGLKGRGTFDWHGATMKSNPGGDFDFGSLSIASKSTSLMLKTYGELKFAFDNENVEAVVDFEKQTGDFISLEQDLATDLPYNSYETTLNKFHWDMATNHIIMEAQDGKSGFFLATEQSQDSLIFKGEIADFDLNTSLLKIDGVEFIRVADAFIYPKDKHVEIEGGSKMHTLLDSRVVADTLNQNHVIQRATINVLSRREYIADGFLEFNVEGFKEQEILFDNVTVSQSSPGSFITVGSGAVSDSANFFLDKRTRFKGNVNLIASSKLLNFKGYAKISSAAIPTQEWFAINSEVDKKDVSIEYDNPKNPEGQVMYVGLFLDLDTMVLYPTVLSPKRNPSDRSIFSATGVLKFDNRKEIYSFGDSSRVLNDGDAGKLFTVSEKNLKVTASGRFDFNKGFNSVTSPPVLVDVVGDFSFFLDTESEYLFETSMNLDFYVPQALKDVIVTDLLSNPELADKVLYASIKNDKLFQHMKNYVPDERKFDKMWKKVKDDERLQLPNGFKYTFFFINNKFLWSPKTQSFITKGRRLQLSSVGGKHIGQVVKGHLEILNDPARGDALTFYFASANGDWYYFSYQNGFLKTVSSNPLYNNAISSLKPKDRRVKTPNGTYYEVLISNPSDYSSFKNKASSAHN